MYHLRVPQTEEELERYYQFRWEMLRKPLHQPKGSERDAWDAMAHHQMVVDEEGNLVAVGRLYINADNEASIRFMATPVRHFLMIKPIASLDDILHRGDWCGQLQQAWYEHIPLSEKMGVRIQQYTGQKFITTMPETGNQNPHHTLFAGSLFSLATLTGWAMTHRALFLKVFTSSCPPNRLVPMKKAETRKSRGNSLLYSSLTDGIVTRQAISCIALRAAWLTPASWKKP